MASVHRRPQSKFFHAAWRDGFGKLHLRSTKQTKRSEALRVAQEFERLDKLATLGLLTEVQVRGVLNDIVKRNGGGVELRSPSCRTFFTQWISAKESVCAPTTVLRYQKVVDGFLLSLGQKADSPLSSITASDVQAFVTQRLAAKCAPSTVQVDGKALRGAFNRAKREGLILANPAEAVELPRRESVKKAVFTASEVKRILEEAEGEWRSVIMIGYYTGQRLTDCSCVEWKDINFQTGLMVFPRTKPGHSHDSLMHPDLVSYLDGLDMEKSGAVCPRLSVVRPEGRRGLSESFKRIMRRAGVDDEMVQGGGIKRVSKLSFHSLRHTYNSILANNGVPEELRMQMIGHKSSAVNRGYTHHQIEVMEHALSKLPSIILTK